MASRGGAEVSQVLDTKSQADAPVRTVAVFKLNAHHPHTRAEMLAISDQVTARC
ncbi:MAG: hypothetical protein IPN53_23290 [Comamonadaceae bacterium]|nr:hypothetical protein [Comamonadaceae bacterium]